MLYDTTPTSHTPPSLIVDFKTTPLEEGLALLLLALEEKTTLSKESVLSQIPAIVTIIGQLSQKSHSVAHIHKAVAKAKSLRQSDNPEGRDDLYSSLTPAQTLEGQTAAMVSVFLAQMLQHLGIQPSELNSYITNVNS